MNLIIEAQALRKTYTAGTVTVNALKSVNFAVRQGEMVAIMGPSGCGKTTMLNCLSGLDDFDSGEIRIAGTSLRELSDNQKTEYRARSMGFIFHNDQKVTLVVIHDARAIRLDVTFRAAVAATANDCHERSMP